MSTTPPMEKLCDIAELNPKFKEKLESDSNVSFVPMAAVLAETSTVTGEEKQYCEVSKGYTPFTDGDLLVAKITPCFENGKITQARLKHKIGFGSTEFHVVRPFEEKLDARYLLHFLRQERIRLEGERKMTGSAGQRRVPANFLASLEIPLPPLEEQKRIADILDRAEALRAKRRAALAQLDELVQSIFVEMFGDPTDNIKKFEIVQLKSLFSEKKEGTKCGPFGSALKKHEYVDSGIPVWTMDNIVENKFIKNNCLFITKEKYQKLKAYSIDEGDILISRAGTVGKMCVVNSLDSPSIISTNLIRLSLNPSKIDAVYFTSLMTYFKGKVGRLKTGDDGAYTFMNTGVLKDLEIPLPPFELQRSFTNIVDQIEKIKQSQQQSLLEINNLFDSLTHEAFTGKLCSHQSFERQIEREVKI